MSEHLSAIDHLRLQLAAAKAERAQAEARAEVLLFRREIDRIAATLNLTSADTIDVPTGVITRASTS